MTGAPREGYSLGVLAKRNSSRSSPRTDYPTMGCSGNLHCRGRKFSNPMGHSHLKEESRGFNLHVEELRLVANPIATVIGLIGNGRNCPRLRKITDI